MNLFYKVPNKELLNCRVELFTERGLPALIKNGFSESPFSGAWFGQPDHGDRIYELCRISEGSRLDMVTVAILGGERWIQPKLNIFRLHPIVECLEQLQGVDGIQFGMPPNSRTAMRLAPPPILIYRHYGWYRSPPYKLGSFYTRSGLRRRLGQLGNILENDLENIDTFVKMWMAKHAPLLTDWEGHAIEPIEPGSID